MRRVGIYTRLSDDRGGEQTATVRQEGDCRKLVEARGWQVVEVFEDVDLSAYKRNVVRPGFDAMIAAVREKRIDTVLAWKLDRLTRRLRDFARLDEECEAAGASIVTVVDGIDTSTSAGRVVASIMTALARAESENISIRVARKHQEMAKAGQSTFGGSRPFGYSKKRDQIIPEEAAAIREGAQRILEGESIRSICADWNRRGITTSTGGPWRPSPLRRMLTAAMLSGQREHHGEIVAPGTWDAILTPEQTESLRAILRDGGRRTSHTNARSYLLSGFLICGRCGYRMVARPRPDKVRRYVCPTSTDATNCGKMAILAEPLEELVAEMIIAVLDSPELSAAVAASATGDSRALVTSIRDAEAQLEQLSRDYYSDRLITRAEFFAARDALQEQIAGDRRQLTGGVLSHAVNAAELVREQWQVGSFDWRRRLIGSFVDHVEIKRAVRGRNTFDPTRVSPVWKF